MKKNRLNFKKDGFTLIELLLSLAIIVILTGASLSIARFSETQKNLVLSANQLKSLIRLAQSYALAVPSSGEHICGFGVYFSDDKTAQLFYTEATDAEFNNDTKTACNGHLKADGTNLLEKIVLASEVKVSQTGTSNDIFFRAPYGLVYSNGLPGGKSYTLQANSVNKVVNINVAGKIE